MDKNTIITISTASSRFAKKWTKRTLTWGAFVDKLSNTKRTEETLTEYFKMSHEEQDAIKDVGGFVGGELKDGLRRSNNVLSRSLITLDADFPSPAFLDLLELTFDYETVVYSTHKHTQEKPRLRIILPLKRPVTAVEYEPIARKLAEVMGIDCFDDTTYQASRLMYYPSTPKDGFFVFKHIEGKWVDPDLILKDYRNPFDTLEWPVSTRNVTQLRFHASKKGDPLEKTGIIGAFCKSYDIESAILTFLADVYSKGTSKDRWTYNAGSTANGLVVYDNNKFAYSNHSTDPISGRLCNAFDLVRIHLFEHLDEDILLKEYKPNTQDLPSFFAMKDFVLKDKKSQELLAVEQVASAREDFSDSEIEWVKTLQIDKTGRLQSSIDNFKIIIENDSNLKRIGGRDLFRLYRTVFHKLPWERNDDCWTDLDDAGIRDYIEKNYKLTGTQKLQDALNLVFEKYAFHPVKDYLKKLEWDGVPRVETLLIDYLGACDNIYVRSVTKKTLVAAVSRVFKPGCKFDHMLTLVGPKGCGKSLLVSKLAKEWGSDTLTDIKGKDAYDALAGVWIMEMGELTALKRAEREAVRHYISKQIDQYRKAYAVHPGRYPRQCIFIGTTNDPHFICNFLNLPHSML